MTLQWFGPRVAAKMIKAQLFGINKTMAEAVEHAKRNHTWQNRTGTLEGSISIAEFAHREGRGVVGLWGSKDVEYALIMELGGNIVRTKGPNSKSFYRKPRPYLRPAADAVYPRLAANIREGFALL